MKTIKVDKKEYPLNNWDYLYNGASLLRIVPNKPGLSVGVILESVPKKYYNDILFTNHTTIDCGVRNTIPSTININAKDKQYKLIVMER